MYKHLIKPLLFTQSPESAHHFTFKFLKFGFSFPGVSQLINTFCRYKKQTLHNVMGLDFPGRVGLAAGFDKDARLYNELACFGFGFIEVGTVTPKPQAGNPKPRLFRLPQDEALINRMGFNNEGVDEMVKRLQKKRRKNLIIGGNIGKNKLTPNENALEDYLYCLEKLQPYVDYFAVNVSSPNTPGLRELQEKEPLTRLLKGILEKNQSMPNPRPVLLKIAPDLTEIQLDEVVEIALELKLSGIIATNTTLSRENLKSSEKLVEKIGAGGLSGKPLKDRSTQIIKRIAHLSKGRLCIIACGGIFSGEDAREKIAAGADLVQVYTGFIYEGPSLVRRIDKELQ